MTKEEIAKLKTFLASEYERNIEAIERVEKLLLATSTSDSQPLPVPVSEVVQSEETPTLIGAVEHLFRLSPDQRLTITQLLEKLLEQHFAFGSSDRHKSVHTAVWRLQKGGIIRTVVQGKGRKPSTYQLVSRVAGEHVTNGAFNSRP
jgi:hypothetical protein